VAQPVGLRALPGRPAPHPLIPESLAWWGETPAGAARLERLPELVAECAAQWDLAVGEPYDAHIALVLRAQRADGTPAVLKLNLPDAENEHEASALEAWPEGAAVRVLEHDSERAALLLERAHPGAPLWVLPEDEALDVLVALLPRLWSLGDPGAPFRRLVDVASRWAAALEERWERTRAIERELLDEAVGAFRELAPSQGRLVLASEDFHGGNVLSSERGWLAIDPKPIVADREFSLVSYVRDRRPVTEEVVRRRLDRLSAELGLDRERLRRWSVAHAVWWGFDDAHIWPENLEAARVLTNC
jgi:streptomycin 6-kinase